MELCALLAEMATGLDQFVWSTWKVVAPDSALKRSSPARATLARFASGDDAITRAQVKAELERLRQLTAALLGGVSSAGRIMAQSHAETFQPSSIEGWAKATPGTLVSQEVKCWRKYVELAGPRMDAQTIERELMSGVARHAEGLLRGAAGA
jgi:hypothetical protein